jgi:hypothetical protein
LVPARRTIPIGQGCLNCVREAPLDRERATNAKRERGKRALARGARSIASVVPEVVNDPAAYEPDPFDSDEFLKLSPPAQAMKVDPDLPF